jgi:hypothetical protein
MLKRGVLVFFGIIFLFSIFSFDVSAGYPAPCNENEDGVQIGDWCYDCSPEEDDVCPDDFLDSDVCVGDKWDYDCVEGSLCTDAVRQNSGACESQGSYQGACKWVNECGGNLNRLYSGGGDRCIPESEENYVATKDKCGAQCNQDGSGCAGGNTCTAPNTIGSCNDDCSGSPEYQCQSCTADCGCVAGWADLDGNSANGCETPIASNCADRNWLTCTFDNDCDWCSGCSGAKSSGDESRCVDKGTCSYSCIPGQCNADCVPGQTQDTGVNYCGGGDIYNQINGCTTDCKWNDGSAGDTLSPPACSTGCSDNDGGQSFFTQGTVTDNNKCTSGSSCPSTSYVDSCSGSNVVENYCNGNSRASVTKACSDFNNKNANTGSNACEIVTYGCGSGVCSGSNSDVACNNYRDLDGSDGEIKESLVTTSTCKTEASCSGSSCCQITAYNANGDCSTQIVGGTIYRDYHNNVGNNVWGTSAEGVETACNDGFDNDCNGKWDSNQGANSDSACCVYTGEEVCDGVDNDCDGSVDEGLSPELNDNQKGVCLGSTKICGGVNGWQESYAGVNGYQSSESSCNDALDNDCDNEKDWDNWEYRGPQKGDNNCAVSVTGISVSDPTPIQGDGVIVTCSVSVGEINSVDAFLTGESCTYIENSWSGGNVQFSCTTNALGAKTASCSINTGKSYQLGDDKATSVNVIVGTCAGYGSDQNGCNNDPDGRCEWCLGCDNNNWWSGGGDRCVSKNSCSYTLTKDQCGAECDWTVGGCGVTDCDELDGCYAGTYRDYGDVNQVCGVDGQCQNTDTDSCTIYVDVITDADIDGYDTQCDNDCNDGDKNINPGMSEVCNGIDDDCDIPTQIDEGLTFINYYLDSDRDGFGTGTAQNLCADPGLGFATKSGDCNDNDGNIKPGANDVCNGVDDDCNLDGNLNPINTPDGSGEAAPPNDKQFGICAGSNKICSGGIWENNYPAGYEAGTEVTCNDAGLDNDCDGVANCGDGDCAGDTGPGGVTCCQTVQNCAGFGDDINIYLGCADDNLQSGKKETPICKQDNTCDTITDATITNSCGTGCCLPGGGVSVCKNNKHVEDIERINGISSGDGLTEICDGLDNIGDWIGANCAGQDCVDTGDQTENYECLSDSDCSLNAGQCGENKCLDNKCVTQVKDDAQNVCEGIASAAGHECSYYAGCLKNGAGTDWNCNFGGVSTLCGANGHGFDVGCSMNPNFKCDVQLCLDLTQNPCQLCYSQCVSAANDPNRSPGSVSNCVENGYWAQCGGA